MGTITRVRTQEPVIALTFDDGPHPEYTPRVLDLLRTYKARATFFVIGQAAERHPDLIRQIRSEGHVLGNHTYSHARMPTINRRERREEIHACERQIGQQSLRLFRPPWGAQTRASRMDLLWLRYKVITWNVVLEDWLKQEPTDLAQQMVNQAKPGCIVLLHDAVRPTSPDSPTSHDRDYMIKALELALPKVTADLRCVTVPEMLSLGRPVYRQWYEKHATQKKSGGV